MATAHACVSIIVIAQLGQNINLVAFGPELVCDWADAHALCCGAGRRQCWRPSWKSLPRSLGSWGWGRAWWPLGPWPPSTPGTSLWWRGRPGTGPSPLTTCASSSPPSPSWYPSPCLFGVCNRAVLACAQTYTAWQETVCLHFDSLRNVEVH